jgi:hypothetical protein
VYLEDIKAHMGDLGSDMTDDQFMIHILNNLTKDYEMQVFKCEDHVGLTTNRLKTDD